MNSLTNVKRGSDPAALALRLQIRHKAMHQGQIARIQMCDNLHPRLTSRVGRHSFSGNGYEISYDDRFRDVRQI